MNYGLPYQGSKNAIAMKIAALLPRAEYLYDIFAGGCAVTHAAMIFNKWQNYVVNDITSVPRLFVDAVNGLYKDETRWISREDFELLRTKDEYVRICWSFGNNGTNYMYSREVEPWKRAYHFAVVLRDYEPMRAIGIDLSFIDKIKSCQGRRLAASKFISKNHNAVKRRYLRWYDREKGSNEIELEKSLESLQRLQSLQKLESLQCLQRLQSLESLERLQSLQRLQSIERLQSNYYDVEIKPNSVIYCDPPYKDTTGYNESTFDHERFYDWCEQQKQPVFISEYNMPEDRFVCVKEWQVKRKFSRQGSQLCNERIFRPRKQL